MTETHDKVRAVFLAALMVVSVFGGTIAFAGTAAANAENLTVDSETPIAPGNTITVTTEVANTAEASFTIEDSEENQVASASVTDHDTDDTNEEDGVVTAELAIDAEAVDGTATVYASEGESVTSSDADQSATFMIDDETAPEVEISADPANDGEDVEVQITSDEKLSDISVNLVREPHGTSETLDKSDFTESTGGDYVYTYTDSGAGEYSAVLTTATDAAENDGAEDDDSDSVTITDTGTESVTVGDFNPEEDAVVTEDQTEISAAIDTDADARIDHNSIRVALSNGEVFERLQYGDDGFIWDGSTLTIDTSAEGVSDLEQGDIKVQIYAEDTGGNSVVEHNTFSVDSESPEVSLTSPENTNEPENDLEFEVTDDSSLNPLGFNVLVEDEEGNVLVDEGDTADGITLSGGDLTVNPTGDDIEVDEWPEGELSATVTAADTHSNTESYDFTVDVDLTSPGVDEVEVEDEPITASDTEGEDEDGVRTVTVHFNESVQSVEGEDVSITYDGESVTDGTFGDDDTTWEGDFDFSEVDVDEEAEFVVENVEDKAGNGLAEDSNSDTVTVDTIEPTVTFDPAESFESHDGTTVVSGDVDLSELFTTEDIDDSELTYEYTTDDEPESEDTSWTEVDSENADSFDTEENVEDGELTVRLTAVDDVDQSSVDMGPVVADNDDPAVTGTYEEADYGDGEAVYGEIDLTEAFDVSDADGEPVTYSYNTSDTEEYEELDDEEFYNSDENTLDTSELDNGPLGLKASVTDLAGNDAESEANVTVNNINIDEFEFDGVEGESAATLNFTSNAELEDLTIEVSQNDDYFDEAESVNLTLDDSELVDEDAENKTYNYTAEFDAPRDGEYTAAFDSANATDGQRLVDSSDSSIASVDAEDPHVTDAQIIDATDGSTTVRVEFNEPITDTTESLEEGVDPVVIGDNRATSSDISEGEKTGYVEVTFNDNFQTGDSPDLNVSDEAFTEEYSVETVNATSASDTTAVHTLELELSEGSNVVSVPAESGSLDLTELDLPENTVVWAYDDDGWQSFNSSNTEESDFTSIEGGQGYIFMMDSDATVDVNVYNQPGSGEVSTSPGSEDVHEGWNLLGHWQEGGQDRGVALKTLEGQYSAVYEQTEDGRLSFSAVPESDGTLEPGEGYWVFVTKDDGDLYGVTAFGEPATTSAD